MVVTDYADAALVPRRAIAIVNGEITRPRAGQAFPEVDQLHGVEGHMRGVAGDRPQAAPKRQKYVRSAHCIR